ncbi:hypothetical protein [Rhizobium aethiopicum]|uniref:Uncharacterized protein n=1 Tax=Rhizobium aethiopicum TaxID=1138170 RepID=A0A7W6MIK1_9HYPH|nr:hypothetical protein [Rhizobium aethiopicum]MBB4192778.1 hypothetical protein [Rhizobium aethiopicum]
MNNQTIINTITIDGFNIPVVKVQSSADVRFLSQKQLFALATPAARAELAARAAIIRSRRAA